MFTFRHTPIALALLSLYSANALAADNTTSSPEKDERMNQWKEKKIVWKNLSKAEKKAKKKEWAS